MTTDSNEVTNGTTKTYDTAGPTLSRRRFGQALVISATATAAGSSVSGTVAAEEDWSLTEAGLDSNYFAKPGQVAIDYMLGSGYVQEATTRVANYTHRRFGDMRDYSGYTGTDALHQELSVGAAEMQLANEKVFTSLNNNIQSADNVAYSKGQIAIAEAHDAGKTEAQAQADMEAAIDDHYADIQHNILNHYETQHQQARHHFEQIKPRVEDPDDPIGWNDAVRIWWDGTWQNIGEPEGTRFHYWDPDYTETESETFQHRGALTYELVNGDTRSVNCSWRSRDNTDDFYIAPDHHPEMDDPTNNAEGSAALVIVDPDTGDEFPSIRTADFRDSWRSVKSSRDGVLADLSGYVTDVYATYSPGDIDSSELIDPTTFATELSTSNNRGFRRAAAESLGMPTNAKESVVIQIHHETDAEGNWVTTSGETAEVDIYTNYQPIDGSGNPVPFQKGETYYPRDWAGDSLFIGYTNDAGEEENASLEYPFTIVEAFDANGNDIQEFQPESTQTHTSDVQQYQEQLDAMRDRQLELQEQYEEQEPSGGATADDSWTTRQMAVVGGVVAAALAGVGLAAGGS